MEMVGGAGSGVAQPHVRRAREAHDRRRAPRAMLDDEETDLIKQLFTAGFVVPRISNEALDMNIARCAGLGNTSSGVVVLLLHSRTLCVTRCDHHGGLSMAEKRSARLRSG